jgi:hypothetical protein
VPRAAVRADVVAPIHNQATNETRIATSNASTQLTLVDEGLRSFIVVFLSEVRVDRRLEKG